MSAEAENPGTSNGWKRIAGKVSRMFMILLIILILLLLTGFVGVSWPFEIVVHLLAGPFFHAAKNLPPFVVQWRSSLLPLACLAIAVVLAHRFIRWWIASKEIRISWRWRHTAAAAALLLSGSAAAIAMSGITHQAAWLFSSPWLESNRRIQQTVAVNHARQILLVLFEYETEHERYPATLDEAVKEFDVSPRILWVEAGPDSLREPFIFLKAGQPSSDRIEPVIVSPLIQPGDRVAVGYSDGSVRSMTLKAWQKLAKGIQTSDE
jgi:hypothetical protein